MGEAVLAGTVPLALYSLSPLLRPSGRTAAPFTPTGDGRTLATRAPHLPSTCLGEATGPVAFLCGVPKVFQRRPEEIDDQNST
mmetsp:Transcript_18439/g.47274  ORF Transcript_18439/g.47274 Transcript_18439/m.47274 type:complete len:83 (+) Transcript_18439:1087-1335(+)